MKQEVFDMAAKMAREKAKTGAKVFTLAELEQAKAEAYQAGRKAGLGEARERLDAMADDYSVQADKALGSYGPAPYYTCLDKANALREGASAIEALAGGGEGE